MPRSTSDVSKLESDSSAAGAPAVRRIDGEVARLRPGIAVARARGASGEWAFEKPAREFWRLRQALNERDEEILRLHARAKQHFEELSRVKAVGFTQERERSEAMDRALSSERAVSDLQRELRDKLATEMRALETMRIAWDSARSELAETRSQLVSTRSAHSLTLEELNVTRGELASAGDNLAILARDLATLQQQLAAAVVAATATEAELDNVKNELDTSNFHLTATRAELKALHAEFTTVQSELGDTCLAMKALRAELGSARCELQCIRAGAAGLDLDRQVPSSDAGDACQHRGDVHDQPGE
jgi:chromosome segregation ATPase